MMQAQITFADDGEICEIGASIVVEVLPRPIADALLDPIGIKYLSANEHCTLVPCFDEAEMLRRNQRVKKGQ